jgi:large subunit ribosomal protein L21
VKTCWWNSADETIPIEPEKLLDLRLFFSYVSALILKFCTKVVKFMYAVVRTGGKQYKVSEGDLLKVEKLEGAVGDTVELSEVLMVGGDKVAIGTPLVPSASVVGKIIEQGKDKKILVFKSKRRKGTRKLNGHRQLRTILKIETINA